MSPTAWKIILIILLILVALVVILPFALNIAGIRVFQFGSVGGGGRSEGGSIVRSPDGGENWESSANSEDERVSFPSTVLDLGFHPTSSDVVFLGAKSGGLWRSANAGKSWRKVTDEGRALEARADVYRIATASANPVVIYVAVFQQNRGRILKSEDEGRSFREVYLAPANGIKVFDLFVHPFNPNQVVALTGQGGVIESRNGGRTWRVRRWFSVPLVELGVNRAFVSEMYVRTSAGSLFKTFDSGENWVEVNIGGTSAQAGGLFSPPYVPPPLNPDTIVPPIGVRPGSREGTPEIPIEAFTLDPRNAATVYAGTKEGLFGSRDGGFSWGRLQVLIPPESLPVRAVAVHPRNSLILFMGAAGNLHRTDDQGVNWRMRTVADRSRLSKLFIHPLEPQVMFALLAR